MELVTAEQRRQLIDNWNLEDDNRPVVKIFSPVGTTTWLIASMNPRTKPRFADSAIPGTATCG